MQLLQPLYAGQEGQTYPCCVKVYPLTNNRLQREREEGGRKRERETERERERERERESERERERKRERCVGCLNR